MVLPVEKADGGICILETAFLSGDQNVVKLGLAVLLVMVMTTTVVMCMYFSSKLFGTIAWRSVPLGTDYWYKWV